MTQHKDDKEQPFLSRWSTRKLEKDDTIEQVKVAETQIPSKVEPQPVNDENEETVPIWQQADADPALKKAALRALLRQPELNVLDGLNEYDDDFTQFASLGNIVTHEMKRVAKWVTDEHVDKDSASQPPSSTPVEPDREEVGDDVTQEDPDKDKHAEDNDIA
jgi:hypothetical protein